jgi:hypothetical protein
MAACLAQRVRRTDYARMPAGFLEALPEAFNVKLLILICAMRNVPNFRIVQFGPFGS